MIYVHIPFCRSFCTYCDFYSEVASRCSRDEQQKFASFSRALAREAAMRAGEVTDQINTLYIGGGTPSVLPLYVFESLLETLRECGLSCIFDEFTVEVNPEDILEKGPAYVEGLLRMGVNRVSMGVQSFDDGILRWMNRRHDSESARKAYAILETAGAPNISIDLIFGLSQLSDSQWAETLDKALDISSVGRLPHHISSYQLSVEPGSALARLVERGEWAEASDELCERQYSMLCDRLHQSGYQKTIENIKLGSISLRIRALAEDAAWSWECHMRVLWHGCVLCAAFWVCVSLRFTSRRAVGVCTYHPEILDFELNPLTDGLFGSSPLEGRMSIFCS